MSYKALIVTIDMIAEVAGVDIIDHVDYNCDQFDCSCCKDRVENVASSLPVLSAPRVWGGASFWAH